jgi:Ribbon-helix-helix protein, copG family
MEGATMKEERIETADVTLPDGTIRAEADYERMALEAETMEFDVEKLRRTGKFRMGRPPLGDGPSSVIQVRVDDELRDLLKQRAENEHSTTSAIVRDVLKAFLQAS